MDTLTNKIKTSKNHRLYALSATLFGPVFIGENLTGDVYQNLLKSEFLPWWKKYNFLEDFLFRQDGAQNQDFIG